MKTSIVKWGNSQGIRLPKLLLESVDLAENDAVEVIADNNSIIIKKAGKKGARKSTKERIADFGGEYVWEEWDTGPSVGDEI
jgi:antitoxin MazE